MERTLSRRAFFRESIQPVLKVADELVGKQWLALTVTSLLTLFSAGRIVNLDNQIARLKNSIFPDTHLVDYNRRS